MPAPAALYAAANRHGLMLASVEISPDSLALMWHKPGAGYIYSRLNGKDRGKSEGEFVNQFVRPIKRAFEVAANASR